MQNAHNPIEYLYYYAKQRPDHVAIQGLGWSVSYRELLRLVRSAATKLRACGLDSGDVVLTTLGDKQIDWVISLALMHEAIPSCSGHDYTDYAELLKPSLWITDRQPPKGSETELLVVDNAWINDVNAIDPALTYRNFAHADATLRIALTSGTTGLSKRTHHTLRRVVAATADASTHQVSARSISLMRLSSAWGFRQALSVLFKGSTLYHANTFVELAALIDQHRIESIMGSTMQISALAAHFETTTQRPVTLQEVIYSGSKASPKQLDTIRTNLCPTVVCHFGATEIGVATRCFLHDPKRVAGGVGYALPGVELQIVDDADQPLPEGVEGILRVRTPYMVAGYEGDDKESAAHFRDGWFYTGDTAAIESGGMLALRGRLREIINLGGVKIDPARIDDVTLSYPGVTDAAAFTFVSTDGSETLSVAVVSEDTVDLTPLPHHVGANLGPLVTPRYVIRVPHIPRNGMGKIVRTELTRLYGDTLRTESSRRMGN